ncbi:MAG: hypothetical protein OHK0040_06600 [bacterium]
MEKNISRTTMSGRENPFMAGKLFCNFMVQKLYLTVKKIPIDKRDH